MKLLQFIKPLLLIALIAISGLSYAQYKGGNASGSDMTISLQSTCSPAAYPNMYKGGVADGYEVVTFIQVNCSHSHVYPDIYKGGNDDGHVSLGITQANCVPHTYLSIYSGGNDSSYAPSLETNQANCVPHTYLDIYTGGNDSSYVSSSETNQANCVPHTYLDIYTGGIDSGYTSSLGIAQADCSLPVYPNMYAGGVDDGYSTFGLTQADCSLPVYPNMYAGGVDDGYSTFGVTQAICTHVYPDIYAGGADDGHAMMVMLTACAPFAEFDGDKLEICEGDTVNYTDLSLGMPTSWAWTFNGGNPTNSTEQNPSVTYNTPGTYSVTLFITSEKGNSIITKTDYILVKPVPAVPTIAASGATTFCDGDSVLLKCNTAYDSYLWSNGDTTQNSYVYTSGNHTVRAIAANGCFSESNTIEVNVLNNPKPTVFVNGPSPSCIGDTLVLTSSSANNYNWMPSGSTAQSITVTSSGTHWVSATYASGCSRLSDPVSVNFGSTPVKPTITALGSTTFCEGDSVILQSSPAPGYLWYPDSQATQSVAIYTSGTYYVGAV
ncbi:MAG: PKD domain-containing protein, partial [Bacteroidales bacterium]|nr:PKD domain-containing protein [Bacteroidales bacterium]